MNTLQMTCGTLGAQMVSALVSVAITSLFSCVKKKVRYV